MIRIYVDSAARAQMSIWPPKNRVIYPLEFSVDSAAQMSFGLPGGPNDKRPKHSQTEDWQKFIAPGRQA